MKKGKRYNNNNNRHKTTNKGQIIALIMFMIFVSLFIFSSVKIVKYIIDSKKNKTIFDNISKSITIKENVDNNGNENKSKYKIDFNTLKRTNNDTIGFLKVNGTDIETIVVKGKDNNYYLTHNFNKEYNVAGWIYADYRNRLDGSDKNIIIYGHNMKNNTMFSTLKNVLNNDWQENEENRYITFITENEESIYEVFSVYQIEVEDYYIKTDFNENEFKQYVDSMKARSKYNFNVEVDEKDSILTLSTCANNNKYRVILHAKKIQ